MSDDDGSPPKYIDTSDKDGLRQLSEVPNPEYLDWLWKKHYPFSEDEAIDFAVKDYKGHINPKVIKDVYAIFKCQWRAL